MLDQRDVVIVEDDSLDAGRASRHVAAGDAGRDERYVITE